MTEKNLKSQEPILTFEGKKYELKSLPSQVRELVKAMQIADTQLRMHEDTLKILTVGRQALGAELNEKLKQIKPIS